MLEGSPPLFSLWLWNCPQPIIKILLLSFCFFPFEWLDGLTTLEKIVLVYHKPESEMCSPTWHLIIPRWYQTVEHSCMLIMDRLGLESIRIDLWKRAFVNGSWQSKGKQMNRKSASPMESSTLETQLFQYLLSGWMPFYLMNNICFINTQAISTLCRKAWVNSYAK